MTTSREPQATRRELPGRVPDFFIVGHAKCGTSALFDMLRRHDQLHMPMKEPRFLASDLRDRFHIPATATVPDTLDEYLTLFQAARSDQLTGEASPTYLTSHTAAREIAELQPRARIIAILREPASFLRSLHLQYVQAHVETETDLRKALALEQARRVGRRIPRSSHRPEVLLYSDHVRYVEQLSRYHAVFPPGQVLVLIYDDFRRDNVETVRQVLRFLDVDANPPIVPSERNPTVSVRAQRLHRVGHALSAGRGPLPRAARASAKMLGLTRSSALAWRNRIFFTEPRPPDEDVMLDLRRRFKPEVVALSDYLGRDLVTLWGYDGID